MLKTDEAAFETTNLFTATGSIERRDYGFTDKV